MGAIKVCIVEDLKDIREGLTLHLNQDERFEVVASYSDAEKASRELPAWQPDIIIMDINLPGMNGIDCIKTVKPLCPQSQFIMFTIYEDDEKVFEALSAGASGYLLKKTPLSRFNELLLELHEGGSPMSTQIARKVINRMRTHESKATIDELSKRENEVLQLLSRGMLYKEIAAQLGVSISTVKQHIHNIYEKMHVQNRTEAINKAFRKA
jgi:RNA polymerase sigma factor (sigma-70 family)